MTALGSHPAPSSERADLDRTLERVRARYRRLDARAAARAMADGALLVDIRPESERAREGVVPGALCVERNVLEWRLAPSSAHRIPELRGTDQTVIIVCSEGYASSLAAASLQDLGLTGATDLVGGFRAWKDAGLPVNAVPRRTVLTVAAV
jgi:rhodanese-related sulfurtransferase